MEKTATFDAAVNANFAVSIPAATRDRLGIAKGDNLIVRIEKAEKIGSDRR